MHRFSPPKRRTPKQEKETIESKAELQMLKNRAEVKERFGLDFGSDFGKGYRMGQGKGFKK